MKVLHRCVNRERKIPTKNRDFNTSFPINKIKQMKINTRIEIWAINSTITI